MDESLYAPPAIKLLIEEDFGDLGRGADFARAFKRVAKELANQAEWSATNFDYVRDELREGAGGLVVTASGALDPLSRYSICASPKCRVHAARQFARTVGLYADVVTIPDEISGFLASTKKPATHQLFTLANHIRVLRELAPMLRAGVVRFWSGNFAYCGSCATEFEKRIDAIVAALVGDLRPTVRTTEAGNAIIIGGRGLDENLAMYYKLTGRDKERLMSGLTLEELGWRVHVRDLKARIRRTLLDLRQSERISSSLLSSSETALLALKRLDRTAPDLCDLAAWENARAVRLPWVNRMSVEQVLRLREEAHKALPAFRETFVRKLMRANDDAAALDAVDELRADAAEVEAELKALNPESEASFRNIAGALGITVAVYGFAADAIPAGAALGGLVSLLGLLHGSARNDQHKEAQLVSKPAYVLVKAKELLEHAPNE